jgi:hypothetical protein
MIEKVMSRLLIVFLSLLFMAGSAIGEGKKVQTAKKEALNTIVAERAEARWHALIEADVDAAYGFLSPAHREIMPIELYQVTLNPGMWRDIRVESTSCDPLVRVCNVVLFLKYDLKEVKGIEMKKKESWIEEEDNWWFVP